MTAVDGERAALRAIRMWLEQQGEMLSADVKQLDGSHDLRAIRSVSDRLKHHHDDLMAFHDALERFHTHSGRPD
jgi:hypothetical protein